MSEWWTYSLADLAMFRAETYFRLFERYNAAVWPAHLVAVAAALALAWLVGRPAPGRSRVAAALLAAAWLSAGLGFLARWYATITWVAPWLAALFVLEALLLLALGVAGRRLQLGRGNSLARRIGLGVLLVALFLHPPLGLLLDRTPMQLEVFGVAPDPTAVATLGAVLTGGGRRWPLLVLPALWCAVTSATHLAIGAPGAWLAPLAALLVLATAVLKRGRATGR